MLFSVLPRIIFDKFNEDDYSKLLMHDSERQAVADLLIQTCKHHSFNGIVLEVWSQLGGRVDDQLLVRLVEDIGLLISNHELKKHN